MTNRKLAYIVKDQKPLVLAAHETVQHACRCMRGRGAGLVLVIDDQQRLSGIFTGRDAVRQGCRSNQPGAGDDAESRHDHAGEPRNRRAADDERWRLPSLPVVENERIWGIVSRGDFKGMEIDQLDVEDHLWECIR